MVNIVFVLTFDGLPYAVFETAEDAAAFAENSGRLPERFATVEAVLYPNSASPS